MLGADWLLQVLRCYYRCKYKDIEKHVIEAILSKLHYYFSPTEPTSNIQINRERKGDDEKGKGSIAGVIWQRSVLRST